jgi:hypothetical protein
LLWSFYFRKLNLIAEIYAKMCYAERVVQFLLTEATLMTINSHITALKQKHEQIKAVIHESYAHHDSSEKIVELKKQKLAIKDEIETLQRQASG